MQFEYLKIKNFLSISEDPVEINFKQLGNIVLIDGKNFDYHDESEPISSSDVIQFHSNAVGKSTIAEAISYGLFGSTIRKRVTHNDAINNTTGKKLEVEIIFTLKNVKYRIVRTRKPDALQLWQDGPPWKDENEITHGGQPATQQQIEKLLGMNHKAFVNVVYFGQHNDYNFLECTAADQRQIAESLLSLEMFKNFSEHAKDSTKEIKKKLEQIVAVYEQIKSNEKEFSKQIEQIQKKKSSWEFDVKNTIAKFGDYIKQIEDQLSKTDIGNDLLRYEKAQEEIFKIKESLPNKQKSQTELESAIESASNKYNQFKEQIHGLTLEKISIEQEHTDIQNQIRKSKLEIEQLEKLPQGAKCPHCYGTIDKSHYKHVMQLHQNKIESCTLKLNVVISKIERTKAEIEKHIQNTRKIDELKYIAKTKLDKVSQSIIESHNQLTNLSKVRKPDLQSNELVLKEKLTKTQELIEAKRTELDSGGPYLEILFNLESSLEDTKQKRLDKKKEIEVLESDIPYYNWWSKGFEDIKSYIIDQIVPSLNNKVSAWMQYLINGKIKIKFNKHLDVDIESIQGKKYTYFATCGGERRRINLAISQAFAHVMMLSSGTFPSIVFLDEVSDSIDQKGITSIYKMICELSKEKQVFVITHNIHLRQMLEGVDTITMIRKDGVSKRL